MQMGKEEEELAAAERSLVGVGRGGCFAASKSGGERASKGE